MIEQQIAKIQRDIARLARTPEEARQIIQILGATNWDNFIEYDQTNRKHVCSRCEKRFHGAGLTIIMTDQGKNGKFCPACYETSVHECDCCDQLFATTGWSYRCFLCKQAYQNMPRQSTCIFCGERYTFRYETFEACNACKGLRNIDPAWERSEYVKVQTHVGRARAAGTPAKMVLAQWVKILEDFNWKCAYCQEHSYEQLDHYIPICKGGGTTPYNCVPACVHCNKSKGQRHPDKVKSIPKEALDRVKSYLHANEFSQITNIHR